MDVVEEGGQTLIATLNTVITRVTALRIRWAVVRTIHVSLIVRSRVTRQCPQSQLLKRKDKRLDKIQRMINCLAHFICKAPKSADITPSFTISTGYQSAVLIVSGNGSAPPYLSDVLHRYSPSPLSCGYSDLRVHKMGRRTLAQERVFQFQYIEPVIENSFTYPPLEREVFISVLSFGEPEQFWE